ncbi:IS110 family RNA-guided transposase [Oceanithermus sp.]
MTGIDVSKSYLDVYAGNEIRRYKNEQEGWKALVTETEGPYVIEATGIYHIPAARFLWQQRETVYVVSPLQVRRYAQAIMTRNKTDALDARVIVEYATAAKGNLRPWTPLDADLSAIRVLVNYARGTVQQSTANGNRLHTIRFAYPERAEAIVETVKTLRNTGRRLCREALRVGYENPTIAQWIDNMTDVSGIGERVAITVVAYGGNLERFEHARAFAAYTGLTPMRKQSGDKEGQARISKMGPGALRQAFFIAARVAVIRDERYRNFYERKLGEGKAHLVALTAISRKLAEVAWKKAVGRL